MAYISTEEVKEIRNAIKEAFKGTGFKFSVRQRHHSSLYVTVKEGPIDFGISEGESARFNQHWYKEHFAGNKEALNFIEKLLNIVNEAKPQREVSYDVDYGSWPNYYQNFEIGTWNKAYKIVEKPVKKARKAKNKQPNFVECCEAFYGIKA